MKYELFWNKKLKNNLQKSNKTVPSTYSLLTPHGISRNAARFQYTREYKAKLELSVVIPQIINKVPIYFINKVPSLSSRLQKGLTSYSENQFSDLNKLFSIFQNGFKKLLAILNHLIIPMIPYNQGEISFLYPQAWFQACSGEETKSSASPG